MPSERRFARARQSPRLWLASSLQPTMQQQASAGTLSLGGVNSTSVSAPVLLISTGPTILAVNPNIGPSIGGTVVTISGSFVSLTNPVCVVDGQAVVTQSSGANILCTMPAPAVDQSQMYVSLQGSSNPKSFFVYDPVVHSGKHQQSNSIIRGR